jgi:hypothetical protein
LQAITRPDIIGASDSPVEIIISLSDMRLTKELWYIAACLAIGVIAAVCITARLSASPDMPQIGSAGDIMVVPLQISHETYGLALVDQKNQTMMIYEIAGHSAYNRLKLIAARTFKYDRQLENYNNAEPKPDQIKNVVMQMLKGPAEVPAEPNQARVRESNEPNAP